MDKKIEKGKVIVADEMINYAEGGVVSKEFVHANAGSLTLFAFDEGQGLNEHSAPFDATVQVLDGEAEIKIDGVPHVVKAGEMIIMPANHPHALFAHKRFKMAREWGDVLLTPFNLYFVQVFFNPTFIGV